MKRGQLKGFVFIFSVVIILSALWCSCKSYETRKKELPDSRDRGTIYVSADESFKPIIDAQVQVYESNYPDTRIIVQYKPEAECLKDLFVDSIRMIIATRRLSKEERVFLVDSMAVSPEQMLIAKDAVAVIVHPGSPDSLFTMNEIRDLLTGRIKKNLIPVFDGINATSTIRYIVDSILQGDSLTGNALAAQSSQGVIEYVARNREAVGFIGVSWIGNKEDTMQVSFLKKVKMAQLESTDIPGRYILPVQANIYLERYPMIRELVYILKENHKGLGHGFANFMSGEIGQLIFKRAYLLPVKKDFILRPVRVRE
jgi:phosphate transport system substrate-binding protein